MTISVIGASTTYIADLKNSLNSKSLISTLHYESTSSLVFTSIFSTKVLKITRTNTSINTPILYIGDSYTGAGTNDNISNPMLISTPMTNIASATNIQSIVTPNCFALAWTDTNSGKFVSVFFKDDTGKSYCINSGNGTSVSYYSQIVNSCISLGDKAPIDFIKFLDTPIYNSSGNVLKTDLKVRTLGGAMISGNIVGVKLLALYSAAVVEVIGNDVALSLSYLHGTSMNINTCRLLITDGVI